MPRKREMGRAANGVGTIRKKSVIRNGKEYTYWEARVTVGYDSGTGKQIQRSISGQTQKEVAQRMKTMLTEVDQGTYQAPCKLTVAEWLDIWQRDYLGDVKESTALLYRQQTEMYIVPHLGAVKLEALNTQAIQKFYNNLAKPETADIKPLSPKTIRNIHGVFHRALEQAVENKLMRANPSDACKTPRVTSQEVHPLDEEQATAFLKEISGHTHEYLYKIALFTGMREGEILGLSWDCVDMEHGTLTVKQQLCREKKKGGKYYFSSPKNGKGRVLALAPSVLSLFREQRLKQTEMRLHVGELWEDTGLVFTSPTGGVLSYRTVYDCFKRVMKKIGMPSVRFHDLRHSYAVMAILNGDDIKTVQENLGHATAAFTLDVYGHVLDQMKRASADRMENCIQRLSAG